MIVIKFLVLLSLFSPLYSIDTAKDLDKKKEKLFHEGSLLLALGLLDAVAYGMRDEIRSANLKGTQGDMPL